MTVLYELINKKFWDNLKKAYIFLLANILVCSLIGFLLWRIIFSHSLEGIDWMLCFIGYPAFFIGFLGGLMTLYNHSEL